MIAEVVRGNDMPALVRYLFGPGRHNEHVNQHLIAGYADAVFSAPDRLWQSQPGAQRRVQNEARELGWEIEYPRSRWDVDIPRGYVWHCSLSIKAEEGPLTDTQWAEAAHAVVEALGFSGADGKTPCRWVAVRHGLSSQGNDHIHIAVNLVREDGTKASTWNDYRKAGAACSELEERFGLSHVPGRAAGRSVPEPSRADREISAARGEPEPLRARLERVVRACAAASRSEAEFIAAAREAGLLARPRYAAGNRSRVTGYAVAERNGRRACNRRTGSTGPVWFGGGKLATDLALPRLRARWQAAPDLTGPEALAAWEARTATSPGGRAARQAARPSLSGARGDMNSAAGLLAAAATGIEGSSPGPLSQAARHMARAAQYQAHSDRPGGAETVREMAGIFMSITMAGTDDGVVILLRDVLRLIDQAAVTAPAGAALGEARQARLLLTTGLAALSEAAGRQAATALTTARRTDMSEPTHEDEILRQVVQAAEMLTQVRRQRRGTREPAGAAPPPAGSSRQEAATPFDGKLRELLGEQRWHEYAADPGRGSVAALIRRAHSQGRNVGDLLTSAVGMRPFEDDPTSPARSVAGVLRYRIDHALGKPVRSDAGQLPDGVAGLLSHGIAPASSQPGQGALSDPAEQQLPPSARQAGRPERGEGR